MTPPRLPLGPSEAAAVAYAVRLATALQTTSGNVAAAALVLGVERRTLDRHIVALGMADLRAAYSRSGRQNRTERGARERVPRKEHGARSALGVGSAVPGG